jgi:hypothetical protein
VIICSKSEELEKSQPDQFVSAINKTTKKAFLVNPNCFHGATFLVAVQYNECRNVKLFEHFDF